ncbi:perforin-1-like [Anomaloglossus baeobatrachus]|uniref:perforin-1-like n=1 Tax=Anomaloglossus baeobatrachus TaxID=238106 RepID=UPI003F50D010
MDHKLCVLFWFLLLQNMAPSLSSPIVTSGCRPGTLKECKEAKFVPGHTLLGEGIDIVTMKTTGFFLFDLQEVDNKCTVCENPYEHFILQKLPKALVDWRPETSCLRNIQSSVSQSKVSVANEATSVVQNDWKVGLNVKWKVTASVAVGGSQSKMAKFADSKSLTDKYNFLSHKLQCSFYSFSLGATASFTPHFQKSLEELPDDYNTNKAEYRRLIANFGTHYVTHVKVGGRTQEVTAVRTCQLAMNGLKIDEVKDCLSVEAEIEGTKEEKSASMNSKFEHCKNKLAKSRLVGNFHQTFKERSVEVIGGNYTFDLLSSKKATDDVYKRWIESLKTDPGLVAYSLDSIHNLVKIKGPKKENLRLAISDYINEMALTQKCSCSGGHQEKKDCSCTCPASKYTSANCCPTHAGAAKLHVTVLSASGLKGDFWSQTDAYVKFKFDGNDARTSTIQDKDNPQWNINFNMGVVELRAGKMYTIEVWDEDNKSDEFLGRCEKVLTSGDGPDTCYLKHGSVSYSVKVTCVSHLEGLYCQDYIPVPAA